MGLGQRYYRDSPLEQTILPQMIAVAFQEANIASGPPDVRPRPTLEFGLGALGLQGSTYRYLPIATFGGARVPPGAPHSPAGPWGLWGVEVARGGLGSAPGIALGGAWTGAARRPALLAPSPHSFVLARGSWRCRGRAAPPTWLGAGLGEARCECARGSLGRGRGAGEAGRGASEVGSGAGGTRAKPHEEDSSSGLPPHLLHGEPRSTVSTFVPGG